MMTEEEKTNVCDIVDCEWFDYAFCDYSSFEEVDDPVFHDLRKQYKEIAYKLKDYIGYNDY